MFNFCIYKDTLGKPKQGIHSIRFMNFAVIDILLTFILAKFIQIYITPNIEYTLILFITFISGIILHRIFCVKTTLDNILFH